MSDAAMKRHGEEIFKIACRSLDRRGWVYEKVEKDSEFLIGYGLKIDHFDIINVISINLKQLMVRIYSEMPFKFCEDKQKRINGVLAAATASNNMVFGGFDVDIDSGTIIYKMSEGFVGCEFTEEYFDFIVDVSNRYIDKYSKLFEQINKDEISISEFIVRELND